MSWPNVILHRDHAEELLHAAHVVTVILKYEAASELPETVRAAETSLAMTRARMEDRGPGDLLRYATDMLRASTLVELNALDRFETAALSRCCRCWSERAEARLMDRSLA